MDYKDVLKSARENLNGSCKVCKVCNGIACSGEVPGMGGKGTGSAFTENMKSLEKVKINMRVLHDVKNPNTSVEMFGKKMKAPIFAAPVSGTTLNMGGKYTEKEYISWVIEGCLKAGIYPMVGDTAIETFLTDNLEVLKEKNADGIAFIKPWENDAIISKMKLAEDAGVFALGVDVDACGLVTLSLHGKNVEPKTLDKIKELKQGFIYNPEFYDDNINNFEDLNNVPLILQKEESNSRKLLDYIGLQNGVKLIPKMEVVSQELITEFVNIGLGIGFSIIDLATRNYKNLKELKINRKVPNINIYLATNKSISLTFASKMFIKYLKA